MNAPEALVLATKVVAGNKNFAEDRWRFFRRHKWKRWDTMIAFFGRRIEEVSNFKMLTDYLKMTEKTILS